jgi:hypothetical protein
VVDAEDLTGGDPAAQLPDGQARTEADLEDAVGRLHVELLDGPGVPAPVRAPVRHDPADQAAGQTPRMVGLGDHAGEQLAAERVAALVDIGAVSCPHRGQLKRFKDT